MKIYVTGICGQLGHDVMNELAKRGHEGVGSDIAAQYAGAADGSAVVSMPYVQLDITDKDAVQQVRGDFPNTQQAFLPFFNWNFSSRHFKLPATNANK